MYDHRVSHLYKCQVVIVHAYEEVSMHLSKPCHISMCLNIHEPFGFDANLRHILETLVLIVNVIYDFYAINICSFSIF